MTIRRSPILDTKTMRISRECWARCKWKKDLWNIVNQSPERKISFRYWESANFMTKSKSVSSIKNKKEVQSAADAKTYWKLGCWQWKLSVRYLSHLVKQQLPNKFSIFVPKDIVLPKSPNDVMWKCQFR